MVRPHLRFVALLAAGCGGEVDLGTPRGDGDGGDGGADGDGTACVDQDHDAFGKGCARGADCDDADATIHPGVAEACDTIDNDCDGVTDEGVRTECGDCNGTCSQTTDEGPFVEPPTEDGVGTDDNGDLTLDGTRVLLHDVWIANTDDSTVSRLDSGDAVEKGRYATLNPDDPHIAGMVLDLPGLPEDCQAWAGPGHCPSRTAVDFDGNVWVANRAFSRQGTVSRIAANLSDCVDRAHGTDPADGLLQTSSDVNLDGAIDWDCDGNGIGDDWSTVCSGAAVKEYWGQDDECIVLSTLVGADDGLPRALAIDVDGNAWVGLYNDAMFVQVSPGGAPLQTVDTAGGQPYGAIIDSDGVLWAANGCCASSMTEALIRIDTTAATPMGELIDAVGAGCFGRYGITLDLMGRVWLAADDASTHGCTDDGANRALAWMYDPTTQIWTRMDPGMDLAHGRPQGIAPDEEGNVWVALSDGWIAGMDENGGYIGAFDVDPTAEGTGSVYSIGVSTDENGKLWVGNRMANTAVRFDPADSSLVTVPIGDRPYTYSDYTGFVFRNVTNPTGSYSPTLAGCTGETTWLRVLWDATVPAGASLTLRVQSGNDLATIAAQPYFGPWDVSPAEMDAAAPVTPNPSSFLRLTFDFAASPDGESPVLHGFETLWECEGGIE